MPKSRSTLISLLVVLATASGFAQTAEEFRIAPAPPISQPLQPPFSQPLQTPPVEQSPQVPLSPAPGSAAGEAPVVTGEAISLVAPAEDPPVASLSDFVGYRYATNALEWIPGGGDQFGMFSIVGDHYEKSGYTSGIGVGMGFHFLDGPVQTDMPPRVFDFSIAYQIRKRLGPLGFDLSAAVMASADFEGSARKGIRFPSHAVGFFSVGPALDMVFGVDFLDRGDIRLLPVAGLVWMANPQLRFELIFPRPRAVYQLNEHYRLYLAGELGGGSWAIRRAALGNDLASYRDLRACLGVECIQTAGHRWAFEVGYLFDRRLEYSSGIGDMPLDDAVLLRLLTAY